MGFRIQRKPQTFFEPGCDKRDQTFVIGLPDHAKAWLTIAMASTLAGNFTILGSIANLIVVQKAAQRGVVIGFWDYFRVGAPLTVITLAIGTLWLSW